MTDKRDYWWLVERVRRAWNAGPPLVYRPLIDVPLALFVAVTCMLLGPLGVPMAMLFGWQMFGLGLGRAMRRAMDNAQ